MFVYPSIKPEDQQTHDQRRKHEDERSHQVPVDRLRVTDSRHSTVTGAEQENDREHSRNPERYSVADVGSVHPEHDPAHNDHDDARNIEVNEVVTDPTTECESYYHVTVFTCKPNRDLYLRFS